MSQSTHKSHILTRLQSTVIGKARKRRDPRARAHLWPRHALLHSRDKSLMAHWYNITNKRKIAISKYKKSTNLIHVRVAQMCSIRLSLTFPKISFNCLFLPNCKLEAASFLQYYKPSAATRYIVTSPFMGHLSAIWNFSKTE